MLNPLILYVHFIAGNTSRKKMIERDLQYSLTCYPEDAEKIGRNDAGMNGHSRSVVNARLMHVSVDCHKNAEHYESSVSLITKGKICSRIWRNPLVQLSSAQLKSDDAPSNKG